MRILIFADYYLPGYRSGGPLRSLVNLVEQLGDTFHFRIVTRDRDHGDRSAYSGVPTGVWVRVGKAEVMYLPPRAQRPGPLRRLLRREEFDVLYLSSFFSPRFTVLPLLLTRGGLARRRPVVLAPRGELASSALALKAAKKRAYLWLARRSGLLRGVRLQASSDFERADIERVLGRGADVWIASDLPALPDESAAPLPPSRADGPLRVVFLSRISRMKNLDGVLGLLAATRARMVLDIWGPVEDSEYWEACRARLSALPANVSAEYRGTVAHEEVPRVLAGYDLFLLPSRGENFGHVILEAMLASLPVLVSDRTPWRGLEEAGVGWSLPLEDPERFVAVLERVASWEPAERDRWRARARAYALECSRHPEAREANERLFGSLFPAPPTPRVPAVEMSRS